MRACWHHNPLKRPTFPEIVLRLTAMIKSRAIDLASPRVSQRGRPLVPSLAADRAPASSSRSRVEQGRSLSVGAAVL